MSGHLEAVVAAVLGHLLREVDFGEAQPAEGRVGEPLVCGEREETENLKKVLTNIIFSRQINKQTTIQNIIVDD
jgi:hypothetical protein